MTPTPRASRQVTPAAASRSRLRRRVAVAVAVTAAVASTVAACGNTDTATQTSTGSSSAAQQHTLTTLDGAAVTIPGSKPAALFFFSVGCGACVGGATSLSQAATAVGAQ